MFVDNSEVVDIIKLVANCKLVDNTKMVSNIKVGDNTREKRLVTIFCQNRAGGRKVMLLQLPSLMNSYCSQVDSSLQLVTQALALHGHV